MADRAGIKSITIDGVTEDCKGVAAIRPSGFSREAIVGADRYHGTALKAAVPGADVTITDRQGLDIQLLQNLVDSRVMIELANGNVWTLTKATTIDQVELSPEEGEIALTFACESCERT